MSACPFSGREELTSDLDVAGFFTRADVYDWTFS